MFQELLPLLTNRAVTMTVAGIGGGRIRLNVIPQGLKADEETNAKINHSNRDEVAAVPDSAIKALTTPLSISATAQELDAQLPQLLTQFVEQHGTLQGAIDDARRQIEEAVQAVADRKKKETKAKSEKKDDKGGKAAEEKSAQAKDAGTDKADKEQTLPMDWCTVPGLTSATNGSAQPTDGGK
jgi:PRTRC genetic system protein E